ncbi:MAG: hypothetical protein KDN18_16920 [Verrucomicrobiae bacterium]|nr:hypothetical protein [Verrucomicrobiae bacterium]
MDDASATLRGFRSQALYVLHRVLTDPRRQELAFIPEGDEDVSVWDANSRQIEAVQVKDYSGDLSLSAFDPESSNGFVSRLQRRRTTNPDCVTKVATYGPLGPELKGAISGEEKHRNRVVSKIRKAGHWRNAREIEAALQDLGSNVVKLDRSQMASEIQSALRSTSVGGSVETAFDLLMYWISVASEEQRRITEESLLEAINTIARYLAGLRDFSAEWGTSIEAVSERELTEEEKRELVSEFRKGVDARFDHILADADSVRLERLKEIESEFKKQSVVLVRGASGQGKSAVCWRFLRNCCPEGARFRVRYVENARHAMKVANALGSHAKTLRFEATVFLDVSPSEHGWVELVGELASAGLRVLVSVREEDFRRSDLTVNRFDFGEVALERIDEEEARRIFEALTKSNHGNPLDFEEAWAEFTEADGGPLLEFTHIVTEGQSLQARISAQVKRLREEIEAGGLPMSLPHLELLALCALANAAGARLPYHAACSAVGLSALTNPSRLFEDEYLLKVLEKGSESFVVGLHAARSNAIVEALFGDEPGLRIQFEKRLLPILSDDSVEPFLLWSFLRFPESAPGLAKVLSDFETGSWTRASGIANALIWQGLNSYESENRNAIREAMVTGGGGWFVLCDAFVGSTVNPAESLLKVLFPNEDKSPIQMTPKAEVFRYLTEWLETVEAPKVSPRSAEWAVVGDLCYWIAFCNVTGPIPSVLTAVPDWADLEDLTCEQVSRAIYGRFQFGDKPFSEWLSSHERQLRGKFLSEMDSLNLIVDQQKVEVVYTLVSAREKPEEKQAGSGLNAETMKRLTVLRRMFPDKKEYLGRAIEGMQLARQGLPDESQKRIPIENLKPPQEVSLNSTFTNLAAFRQRRPASWTEYSEAVLLWREQAAKYLKSLEWVWAQFLEAPQKYHKVIKAFPQEEIRKVSSMTFPPSFPKTAVDPWGILSEGREVSDQDGDSKWAMRHQILRRFDPWRKALQEFSAGIAGSAKFAVDFTAIRAKSIFPASDVALNPEAGRYFLWNLGEAWKALHEMQKEFRSHFGSRVEERILGRVEKAERESIRDLWAVGLSMFQDPASTRKAARPRMLAKMQRKEQQLLSRISEVMSECVGDNVSVEIYKGSQGIGKWRGMVVSCDFSNAGDSEAGIGTLNQSVTDAASAEPWELFEWQEMVVKWPAIILIPLVRGRVLTPVIYRIDTATLLMKTAGGDSDPPIIVPDAITIGDLAEVGLQSWKHPVLDSLRELREGFWGLNFVLGAYLELLDYSREQHLNTEALSIGRRVFRESMEQIGQNMTPAFDRLLVDLNSIDPDFAEEKMDQFDRIRSSWVPLTSESIFEGQAKPERVRTEIENRILTLAESSQELEVLYFEVSDRITRT